MADEVTGQRARWALPVAGAVLVAALAFAGWAGYTWWQASNDDAVAYTRTRDEVLATGRAHVRLLTTLDSSDVDGELRDWMAVSTGGLRDELASADERTKDVLRQAGTLATGRVLDAAVSELDTRTGTATMLVSVEIETTKDGEPVSSKRNRFAVGLERTETGWLTSAFDPVPLGTS